MGHDHDSQRQVSFPGMRVYYDGFNVLILWMIAGAEDRSRTPGLEGSGIRVNGN